MIRDIKDAFERHADEHSKFDRVKDKPSLRADLSAFIRLDELVPSRIDIVAAAEHDQIWLEVELSDLAKAATEEDIVFLRRCGVMLDGDSLSMFV